MSLSRLVLLLALACAALLGGCDGGVPTRTSDEERAAFGGKPMPPEARAKMRQMRPQTTPTSPASR